MAASDSDFCGLKGRLSISHGRAKSLITTDNTLTAWPLNTVKPTCQKQLIFAWSLVRFRGDHLCVLGGKSI